MPRGWELDAAVIGEVTDLFLLHKAGGLAEAEFEAAKAAVGVDEGSAVAPGAMTTTRAAAPTRKGSGGALQLFVSLPAGDPVAVEVPPDATVAELRQQLAAVAPAAVDFSIWYAGRQLDDSWALSDAGVAQQASLDARRVHQRLSWGKTGTDWDTDGAQARRVRNSTGWKGSCAMCDPPMGAGRHMWALKLRIQHTGCNFSVACMPPETDMENQLYIQRIGWVAIMHGDAYVPHGAPSVGANKPFKPADTVVFCLDGSKGVLDIWRGAWTKQGDDEPGESAPVLLISFSGVRTPVHACVCSLAAGDNQGADIIEVPEWARAEDFRTRTPAFADAPAGAHIALYSGK